MEHKAEKLSKNKVMKETERKKSDDIGKVM